MTIRGGDASPGSTLSFTEVESTSSNSLLTREETEAQRQATIHPEPLSRARAEPENP